MEHLTNNIEIHNIGIVVYKKWKGYIESLSGAAARTGKKIERERAAI